MKPRHLRFPNRSSGLGITVAMFMLVVRRRLVIMMKHKQLTQQHGVFVVDKREMVATAASLQFVYMDVNQGRTHHRC